MEKSDSVLSKLHLPGDLKKIPAEELTLLAEELRTLIIGTVSENGGHLAPNLGVVELTIALHRVFQTPQDHIVWDVGHQSYAHKLLTGRLKSFSTIRKIDGLSGFTLRSESEHDCFGAGHAGTAISSAMGFSTADDLQRKDAHTVAVTGDGSLICGISLEALNNLSCTCKNMILVLNDNKMSISKSIGAIPNYLNQLITGKSYNRFKAFVKMMVQRMPGGKDVIGNIQNLEASAKNLFVPGIFFEELGPIQFKQIAIGIFDPDGIKDGLHIADLGIDLAAGKIFPERFDQFTDRFIFPADQVGKFDHGKSLGFCRKVFLEIVVAGKFSGKNGIIFPHLGFDEGVSHSGHDGLPAVFRNTLPDGFTAAQIIQDGSSRRRFGKNILGNESGEKIHLDDLPFIVNKTAAVGISVKSGPEVGFDLFDFCPDGIQRIGFQGIGLMIGEGSVQIPVERDDFKILFDPGDFTGPHGIGIIHHHFKFPVHFCMGLEERSVF